MLPGHEPEGSRDVGGLTAIARAGGLRSPIFMNKHEQFTSVPSVLSEPEPECSCDIGDLNCIAPARDLSLSGLATISVSVLPGPKPVGLCGDGGRTAIAAEGSCALRPAEELCLETSSLPPSGLLLDDSELVVLAGSSMSCSRGVTFNSPTATIALVRLRSVGQPRQDPQGVVRPFETRSVRAAGADNPDVVVLPSVGLMQNVRIGDLAPDCGSRSSIAFSPAPFDRHVEVEERFVIPSAATAPDRAVCAETLVSTFLAASVRPLGGSRQNALRREISGCYRSPSRSMADRGRSTKRCFSFGR